MEYTARYLVKIEPGANNNKWYKVEPHGDSWTASWGRVGNEGQSKEYPRSQYEKKLTEKIRKGYKDQTELVKDLIVESEGEGKEKGTGSILDVDVRKIVERLMAYAKAKVAESYKVTANQTTQAQCDEAQRLLNELAENSGRMSLAQFNQKLVEIFTVIPRRMQHVQDYLADEDDRKHGYERIMQREQDTLDSMKSLIVKPGAKKDVKEADEDAAPAGTDFLGDKGLEISQCTDEEIENIKNHLGRTLSPKFKKAWRVTNVKTQKAYDDFCKANKIGKAGQKLYWHGSRNENWWSILQTGLVLRPTNAVITGKMFGYGLYMANKAMKSYGYTSGRGSCWARGNSNTAILAVMQCAEGKAYHTKHHSSEYYSYDWKKLQAAHPGCHSLFAEGGADLRNDEIIVYKQEQVTIKYLVELEG